MKAADALEIKFVDFHYKKTHVRAACLWWLKEIHVDLRYEKSPFLQLILKHESKHWEFAEKILGEKSFLKRWLVMFQEIIWDELSNLKIDFLEWLTP